jgi:hypothetical protein
MEAKDTVILKKYNYNTHEHELVGEVSIGLLARNMTKENFAEFLDEFCNGYSTEYRQGQEVGRLLHTSHRTLQASAVRFLLGIITGLSEQEYTDARNETAVKCGKRIANEIESGALNIGYMI